MGAWSNPTHSWNGDDMDSSDGTNAKKLVLRNAAATASGAYRAEINETNGAEGVEYHALRAQGASLFDRANTGQTDPVLKTDGQANITNATSGQLALRVQGKTQLERLDANDAMAINVDGGVSVRANENDDSRCGALRPISGIVIGRPDITDIAQWQLLVNGNKDDRPEPTTNDSPHVKIGWRDDSSENLNGNVVAIRPKKLLLGGAPWVLNDQDVYRIKAVGSTRIEPENVNDVALHVAGRLDSDSVRSNSLDTNDSPGALAIGAERASQLAIGTDTHAVTTSIHGISTITGPGSSVALTVNGHVTIQNRPTQPPSTLYVPGDATSGGTLVGASLDINGAGDVSGALAVHGTLTGSGTVAAATFQQSGGTFNAGASAVNAAVPTNVSQSGLNASSLTVEHGSATTSQAALRVKAVPTNPTGLGVRIEAPIALEATGASNLHGQTTLDGDVTINGTTGLNNSLKMGGNRVVMGSGPNGEVYIRQNGDVLEFYVRGTLHFYIDNTSGHSV